MDTDLRARLEMFYQGYTSIPYNTASFYQVGSLTASFLYSLCVNAGILYVGGTKASDTKSHVWSLNEASDTWDDAGSPGWGTVVSMASLNNVLYVTLGGGVAGVYYLTPPSTWNYIGNPGVLTNSNCVVANSGKLYLVGANDGTVYEYQSGTTWSSIGIPGPSASSDTWIDSHAGNLYAKYVSSGSVCGISVWAGSTTWNSVGTVTLSGGGYLRGGYSDGTTYYVASIGGSHSEVFYYTAPSTWVSIGSTSTCIGAVADSLVSYKNSLYCAGIGSPGCLEQYVGNSTWVSLGAPKTGVYCFCSEVLNGRLYVGTAYSTDGSGQVFRLGRR